MGIFTRVRDIIQSNVNAMLDKAEDPEKLIRLMIQEMEDTLVEIKASCAQAIAEGKRLERRQEEAGERAGEWARRAELAVDRGRDDLAREALVEKRRWEERARGLDRERETLEEVVARYQDEIAQIEEKLASVRERQRALVHRHRQARQRREAQRQLRRADSAEAFVRFEQFETRIERMEAEADLVNSGRKATLEEAFAELEHDEAVEAELQALKQRRKPAP
ncbi:MAG: phage shock protein PspA [Deferrisomatales bacterium]